MLVEEALVYLGEMKVAQSILASSGSVGTTRVKSRLCLAPGLALEIGCVRTDAEHIRKAKLDRMHQRNQTHNLTIAV